jgi:AcrR family transcriptional regulator
MSDLGKREANKRATRAALQSAAKQLFAERGFAATTVRDIADAAGVTERTFFRYFAAKEELLLDEVLAMTWQLQEEICARPADEPTLIAVGRAVQTRLAETDPDSVGNPLLLFLGGRPLRQLGTSAATFLLGIENAIATAVQKRLIAAGRDDAEFEAELVGRLGLALIRSALIRDTQLRAADPSRRPDLAVLLGEALDATTRSVRA